MTSHPSLYNIPDYDRWLTYVRRIAETYNTWKATPSSTTIPYPHRKPHTKTPGKHIVICSPHPDDECLNGLLALRLLHEDGASVTNLAVTFGSDPGRRGQRALELEEACAILGFGVRIFGNADSKGGLSHLQASDPAGWLLLVEETTDYLVEEKPDLVIMPHAKDRHPTHISTHRLIKAALEKYTAQRAKNILIVETEYWHPQPEPNLLVGAGPEDVAHLITALARHRGEMARAPYHLTFPAWLMDNVRRGGELLTGYGGRSELPLFGILYRVYAMSAGGEYPPAVAKVIGPGTGLTFDLLSLSGNK